MAPCTFGPFLVVAEDPDLVVVDVALDHVIVIWDDNEGEQRDASRCCGYCHMQLDRHNIAEYVREVIPPTYRQILRREWRRVECAKELEGLAVPPADLLRSSRIPAGLQWTVAVELEGLLPRAGETIEALRLP